MSQNGRSQGTQGATVACVTVHRVPLGSLGALLL